MSRKHFSVLLIGALLVVIAITLLVPGRTSRDSHTTTDLIFPGLQDRINQADRVTITAGGARAVVTLTRGDQDWTVDELSGYPARWATVRGLLAGLAQARIVEIKTGNPEYYDRLGVEDTAGEGATGLLVTVGMGEEEVALILGKQAEGRSGRYLRPAGSAQSLLSDFDAEVPGEASGWVEREVADISASDVREVEIEHPDGDRIHVVKAAQDETEFSLDNLPAGREPASNWAVNSLGNVLSALQLDAVDRDTAIDWGQAVKIRLRTFAGLQVDLDAVVLGEDHWIRLAATGAADNATEREPQDVAAGTENEGEPEGSEGTEATEEANADALRTAVDAFNARVAGWAYRIPAYKFEAMTKRLEDVLKALDEDAD